MIPEADQICPNLWQGSAPPIGEFVRDAGFSMVVLCAEEYQPASNLYPGVEVVHAPNDDCQQLRRDQLALAVNAARQVADAVRQGRKVLVTCRMGLNRSGLVSALAMHFLTGWPGWKCVRQVKQHRQYGLSNRYFAELIERLPDQSATTAQASSYA